MPEIPKIDEVLKLLEPKAGRKSTEFLLIVGLIGFMYLGQIGPILASGQVPTDTNSVMQQILSQVIQAGMAIYYARQRSGVKSESKDAKIELLTKILKGEKNV